MATEPCTDDSDCGENEMCFTGTSWFDDQLPWENNTNVISDTPGCACNSWNAWMGKDCTELSMESYMIVVWTLVLTLINFICMVISARSAYIVYQTNGKTLRTAAMFTTVLTFVGSIGNLQWLLSEWVSVLLVKGPFIGPSWYVETDPYKGRFNFPGFLGAGLASVCFAFAAVTISLLWIELAQNSSRIILRSQERAKKYRLFVLIYCFVIFLGLVAGAIYERGFKDVNIQGFLIPIFSSVAYFTYIVGALRLTIILRKASTRTFSDARSYSGPNNSVMSADVSDQVSIGDFSHPQKQQRRFYRVILIVRNTAMHMCICFTLLIASSLVFTVVDLKYSNGKGDGWREIGNPDNLFSYIRLCYLLLQSSLVYGESVMCSYYYLSILKPKLEVHR